MREWKKKVVCETELKSVCIVRDNEDINGVNHDYAYCADAMPEVDVDIRRDWFGESKFEVDFLSRRFTVSKPASEVGQVKLSDTNKENLHQYINDKSVHGILHGGDTITRIGREKFTKDNWNDAFKNTNGSDKIQLTLKTEFGVPSCTTVGGALDHNSCERLCSYPGKGSCYPSQQGECGHNCEFCLCGTDKWWEHAEALEYKIKGHEYVAMKSADQYTKKQTLQFTSIAKFDEDPRKYDSPPEFQFKKQGLLKRFWLKSEQFANDLYPKEAVCPFEKQLLDKCMCIVKIRCSFANRVRLARVKECARACAPSKNGFRMNACVSVEIRSSFANRIRFAQVTESARTCAASKHRF